MRLHEGFMEPDGTLHECEYMEHIYKAEELCETFGYTDDCQRLIGWTAIDCENYLLMKGWMEIGRVNILHGIYGIALKDGSEVSVHLSDAQKKFLKDNLANAFNDDQYRSMMYALDMDDYVYEVEKRKNEQNKIH